MAGVAAVRGVAHSSERAPIHDRPILNPSTLAPFVDPLPIPPVARPSEVRSLERGGPSLPYYRIETREFTASLHRDLNPTRQWGYASCVPGPTFDTESGQALLIDWHNALPARHLLPVDHTLHGAEADKPEARTVAHVHGARVPPESDGYPEHWFAPGSSRLNRYPNAQDAATLWYHDHAMGITRLNILAGLFGVFIVRDRFEAGLNLPRAPYEVPLVLYDRTLDLSGQLSYPTSGKPNAPWISEFYGNLTLCNGKIRPYLEVEPRRYRFRLLNAANGRFFALTLSSGLPFQQIGTDMGLLPAPVESRSLTLFPAERADVIVDFRGLEGQRLRLQNVGEELLEFRVGMRSTPDDGALPRALRPLRRIAESEAVRHRVLTLGEHDDATGNPMMMLLNGARWHDPVTEQPVLDSVEIWSLVNLGSDAHPIHLHLVRFQILDRRSFDLFAYNATKTLKFDGPAIAPSAGESGWKDTVRADPGMVTRIIVRFEGYAGRYVWHCHLLEHEDNEMMRPFEVLAPSPSRRA
jgi:spore coat protein A